MRKRTLFLLVAVIVVFQFCFLFELCSSLNVWKMVKYEFTSLVNPNAYANINPDTDLFVVSDIFGRDGYMDRFGNIVIPPKFCIANDFKEGLARVIIGKKYGFIDKTGRLVIKNQFSYAGDFDNGYAVVSYDPILESASTYPPDGVINKDGKQIQPPIYQYIGSMSEGMASFRTSDNLCGFFDQNYQVSIIPEYSDAGRFNNGLAPVKDKRTGLWGLIDKQNHLKIPYQFKDIKEFYEGFAAVQDPKTGLWGFIDAAGTLKSYYQFQNMYNFSEGFAFVEMADKQLWGAIDSEGRLVIPFSYVSDPEYLYYQFEDGLAVVAQGDNKYIVIDNTGRSLIGRFALYMTFTYEGKKLKDTAEECYGYSGEGLHWVSKVPGKLHFFDNKGNTKFEVAGDAAGEFSEGLCPVYKRSIIDDQLLISCGYINDSGKLVIGFRFDYVGTFTNGIARVSNGNSLIYYLGCIDKNGRFLWELGSMKQHELELSLIFLLASLVLAGIIIRVYKYVPNPRINYDELNPDTDLLVIKDKHKRNGYMDTKGNIAIKPRFAEAFPFHSGLARVKTFRAWRYIDRFGKQAFKGPYLLQEDFEDGHAFVLSDFGDVCWGVIDTKGNLVVPFRYQFIRHQSEGLYAVQDETGLWGYLDENFKEALPFFYADAGDFRDGLAGVKDKETGLWGFVDKQGNLSIPYQFGDTSGFSDGLAAVQEQESALWGFIDMQGKLAIPYAFSVAEDFEDGLALVANSSEQRFVVNKSGRRVMDNILDYGCCGEGLHWAAKEKGKLLFFHSTGEVAFIVEGDTAGVFAEGLCAVGKAQGEGNDAQILYGYIDAAGQIAIDFAYTMADSFAGGIAKVYFGKSGEDQFGYIDRTGRFIREPT